MDILGTRIFEKFASMASAFRFFDGNSNQKISFTEFCSSLEHLRVKLQSEDLQKIFNYLDKDGDGHIGYNEFCNLAEERRKGIDPF
jgi:Ca2+-binding EF-hand superfamily protein